MRTRELALLCLLAGCTCANQLPPRADDSTIHPSPASAHMKITVGTQVFSATLHDNETVAAFKAMLPLTLDMTDLNANEKYCLLPKKLPANASNPGTIQAGDVMLYGSNTLVIFYKAFPTPYSYTRIGKVEDASGLAAALGSGSVTVTLGL